MATCEMQCGGYPPDSKHFAPLFHSFMNIPAKPTVPMWNHCHFQKAGKQNARFKTKIITILQIMINYPFWKTMQLVHHATALSIWCNASSDSAPLSQCRIVALIINAKLPTNFQNKAVLNCSMTNMKNKHDWIIFALNIQGVWNMTFPGREPQKVDKNYK